MKTRRLGLVKKKGYRSLFEHLPDCALLFDQSGLIIDASAGAIEMLGYTRAELASLDLGELFPVRRGGQLRETIKQLFGAALVRAEMVCRRKNGEVFTGELSASRFSVAGEQLVQVIVRDVEETMKVVRCLRESDSVVQGILDCSLDAIISIDADGQVLEFNPAAEALFGYLRDEALGCSIADLIVPPGLREAYHIGLKKCVAGSPDAPLGQRMESRAMRRDRSEFSIELSIAALERGDRQTFTAYISDISEREHAASRLAEGTDHLSAILSATSDGMVLLDRQGRVSYANRSFEEMVGCSADVIKGSTAEELNERLVRLRPDPSDAFEHALGVGLGADSPNQPLFRRCRISGLVKRTLRVSWMPVGKEGEGSYGRLAVFRDVTWEDEAHRAKDDLIGNVSHELRTPLTSIQGFVQLLSEERAGPVSEKQRNVLGIIVENVDRLKQLVADLLDVDRVTTAALEPAELDLVDVLTEVVGGEQGRASRKGLDLQLDIPPLLNMVGDRERLYQVFQNLVSNAVKYTPEGHVKVTASSDLEYVTVEIEDTGVGINEAELPRVFDRFFRSTREYATKVGGTGLGLSIVKALVERHGGEIEVDSHCDTGTRFRIVLPVRAGANGSASFGNDDETGGESGDRGLLLG